jgi:hypothetical protein
VKPDFAEFSARCMTACSPAAVGNVKHHNAPDFGRGVILIATFYFSSFGSD